MAVTVPLMHHLRKEQGLNIDIFGHCRPCCSDSISLRGIVLRHNYGEGISFLEIQCWFNDTGSDFWALEIKKNGNRTSELGCSTSDGCDGTTDFIMVAVRAIHAADIDTCFQYGHEVFQTFGSRTDGCDNFWFCEGVGDIGHINLPK